MYIKYLIYNYFTYLSFLPTLSTGKKYPGHETISLPSKCDKSYLMSL